MMVAVAGRRRWTNGKRACQAAGKSFTSSSAGALGRARPDPSASWWPRSPPTARSKANGGKLEEWKKRMRMEIRIHAAQAILDHHHALTGRATANISEVAFASGETWLDRQAARGRAALCPDLPTSRIGAGSPAYPLA